MDSVEKKWCYAINSEIGDGKTPEDILIDANHPYMFNVPVQGCNNIDDLIMHLYKDENRQSFYRFTSSRGIIIYYKRSLKTLFDGHSLCYFKYSFSYTEFYDLYTNEYIANIESDDIAYVSLLTTVYGSLPSNNDIVGHRALPFDFYFLDCIESFKVLQFDTFKPNKEPKNCTRIDYSDDRFLDTADSIYMLYVSQTLSTISYYGICAIIHGLRTGQFDITKFQGRLFVYTGDRGVVIQFNSTLKRYIKLFTKLILKTKERSSNAEDIVKDFYKSENKILYVRCQ